MARELPPGYTLHTGYPPVDKYVHLRTTSGLSPQTAVQAAAAFNGSWYGCYISFDQPTPSETSNEKEASEIVAMGRIIGDGGWYFVIADMAVLPTHQRKGLGDYVLKHLIQKIKSTPPMSTALENGGARAVREFAGGRAWEEVV
jgi:GNAT superfamily N-acetyltransferase